MRCLLSLPASQFLDPGNNAANVPGKIVPFAEFVEGANSKRTKGSSQWCFPALLSFTPSTASCSFVVIFYLY